jgi:8-oxo-dGTP pyrophosphatase MutT (NUDIX family)
VRLLYFTAVRRTVAAVADHPDAPRWQVHGERELYDNTWVRLVQVDVTAPDGNRWWHHVVRLQTVAAAVVVDEQDRVLMLWRHRFVPDSFGWELPGGIVGPGETGATTAARETEEETGWRPTGDGEHLITFQPMPGMVDTPHEVYLFRGAEHIGEPTDAEEAGRVAWLPLADVVALVNAGQVASAGSLVGLLLVLASRRSES